MLTHSPMRRLATAVPVVLALGACAGGEAAERGLSPLGTADVSTSPTPVRGLIVLCKNGTDASFNVTFDNGTPTSESLTNGECRTIINYTGGFRKWTDVAEQVPANTTLDSIVVETVYGPTAPGSVLTYGKTVLTGTSNAGAWVGLEFGATMTFWNTFTPPPPPGGEGCTPGYWKQSQHFDSWEGYLPTQTFQSVFGSTAFGSMTLLDVLGQGGGGIKALGRHTVAALLNSASGGVDYDLTTAAVISAFNAAVASGDYTTQKDIFEGFNEQGCPLN